MGAPLILIPPSEGKSSGGRGRPWSPGTARISALDAHRVQVTDALVAAMAGSEDDRARLLGVKGEALAAATVANLAVRTSGTRPAIERYTGVLYDALDAASIRGTMRRRLGAQVLIASGLFGLVAPSDPIPAYKLKTGAALPGIGRLGTFWRPHVDAALAPLVAGRTVWNLWPNEHAATWGGSASTGLELTVRFLDEVPDGRTTRLVVVSHWNKLLKGALVRHVLETQIDDPDGLAGFEHPLGYRFEPGLTEVGRRATAVSLVKRLGRVRH